jgi:hypothetical protein
MFGRLMTNTLRDIAWPDFQRLLSFTCLNAD